MLQSLRSSSSNIKKRDIVRAAARRVPASAAGRRRTAFVRKSRRKRELKPRTSKAFRLSLYQKLAIQSLSLCPSLRFCCVKQQLTCNLEAPCEKGTGICVKQSCRMCCCFAQRNIKLVSIGGDQGFISCVWRSCFCVDICQIPPKNMFCEIVGFRLMGPQEKNKDVFPAGEGDTPQKVVSTSAANFGRADTGQCCWC